MRAKVAGFTVAHIVHSNRAKLTDDMILWPPLPHFVTPPEALSSRPQYGEKLDVFCFGALILHMHNRQLPLPAPSMTYDPQNPGVPKQLTEVERQQKYLDIIDKENPLRAIAESCLQNLPSQRPSIGTVVSELEQIHCSNPPPPANNLEIVMDNLALKEKQGQLKDETAQLKQQIQMLTQEVGQKDSTIAHLSKERLSEPLPIAEVSNLIQFQYISCVFIIKCFW